MKLSSRKELLREAEAELKKIQKSTKHSSIKESSRIEEFSLTGELATDITVYTDRIPYTAMANYIRQSDLKDIQTKVETAIKKVGEKYGGKMHYYNGVIISFDGESDSSMIEKVFLDIKRAVEPMINLNLFELYVSSYVYKSSGVLGTKVGRGKITKWFIGKNDYEDSSIGRGDSHHDTFEKNINNVLSEFPIEEREVVKKKIDRICESYFKDKSVLVKDTDWVKELTKLIQKMVSGIFF